MVNVDDADRSRLNTEFEQLLEEQGGSIVGVVVETEPGIAEEVSERVLEIGGVELADSGIISPSMFAVAVPSDSIPQLTKIDGVELVHHDRKVSIKGAQEVLQQLPFLTPERDPVRSFISESIINATSSVDRYTGSVAISEVEVPHINFAQLPPGDPVQLATSVVSERTRFDLNNKEFVPTERSVDWIRDSSLTNGSDGSDTKIAVLDTGHTPVASANGGRSPHLESQVPGEPPLDGMGHGSWCTYTAVGQPAPSTWGTCKGVAEGAHYAHYKCLNTFPGFGQTSWILKSMRRALDWGADVVSMSLGGKQQGPVDEDPYCRFIERNCKENAGDDDGAIFVVAAGNSGPDQYQIGSPGVAPKALTVGSWSLKDDAPSFYSSRGPQGEWYGGNGEEMDDHVAEYGVDEFVKPDVAAPGGGRETAEKDEEEAELLHQVETGWVEGMHDGLRDTRGMMKGTSMATPHVAGLVLRLYEAGIIHTAAEVKQVVDDRAEVEEYPDAAEGANETYRGKNIAVGFGPIRESLFEP